jgi:hypothetical protein
LLIAGLQPISRAHPDIADCLTEYRLSHPASASLQEDVRWMIEQELPLLGDFPRAEFQFRPTDGSAVSRLTYGTAVGMFIEQ